MAIAVIVTLANNVHCHPVASPDVGSAEADGQYQYDTANEYNLGQYEAPTYDTAGTYAAASSDDGDDNSSFSSSNEYDDYPANIDLSQQQQRRRRADTPLTATELATAAEVPDEARRLATVALSDLVGAVEHTLVHSAQKLAVVNATGSAAFNSTETSTVIALPIRLPEETSTATTTTVEPELAGTVQAVQPSDSLNLLSVIAVSSTTSTAADDDQITTATEKPTLISIADNADNVQNITILQTINSTQVHAASTDANGDQRPEHVQHQHITLFSAGAGIFPNIPAVQLDEQQSANRSEAASSSSSDSSSGSSDEENGPRNSDCESGAEENSAETGVTSKCAWSDVTTKATTASGQAEREEAEQKAKTEKLKEKIAEVEAEPVILTQGI